jgi:5-methylcytosine-specific restriction enzyme A
MMLWPSKHFERFHDWPALRSRRSDGFCICGRSIDPAFIDDFDRSEWCSAECFKDVAIRCGLVKPPLLVFERDRGICARCRCDAETATRAIQHLRRIERWDFQLTYLENRDRTAASREAVEIILAAWNVAAETRSLWDADHIVPVVEGGGGCGLDNYRTLCVACHKEETADLASRRAASRRAQRSLPAVAAEPES